MAPQLLVPHSPSLHHPSVLKIIRHRHRIPFPLISLPPPPVFGTLKKGHVRCVGDATNKTHELGVTKKKKKIVTFRDLKKYRVQVTFNRICSNAVIHQPPPEPALAPPPPSLAHRPDNAPDDDDRAELGPSGGWGPQINGDQSSCPWLVGHRNLHSLPLGPHPAQRILVSRSSNGAQGYSIPNLLKVFR